MKKIQFTKDHDGFLEGNVLTVDDGSAEDLIDKQNVAKEYDGKGNVVPTRRKPGVVHVAIVGDADYPAQTDDEAEKPAADDDEKTPAEDEPAKAATQVTAPAVPPPPKASAQ